MHWTVIVGLIGWALMAFLVWSLRAAAKRANKRAEELAEQERGET